MSSKLLCASLVAAFATAASAALVDRPTGFKIGQRMTLKPYVDLSFVIDSNPDQQNTRECGYSWVINPGLSLSYKAENWMLDLTAFYRYNAYMNYANQLDQSEYGENLRYTWSNARASEKGWSLMLSQQFHKINQDDNMQDTDGRGLWRNNKTLQANVAVERRFTDKFHAALMASYYWLDYDNDGQKYAALYGWSRWNGAAEVGYAASRWTDLLLTASYQRYYQDNDYDLTGSSKTYNTAGKYSGESQGVSFMAGLGSYATDRISYRVLGGWSIFEYGDSDTDNGFVYSVSGNWKISDTWTTMLMAQSQYQPSEREYGSANRVDSVSWGLAKSLIRGKLTATLNLTYRRETRAMNDASSYDYDEDIVSGRLGLNYTLNRFLGIFAHVEYQNAWFTGDTGNVDRDYDRIRGTIGVRLTY